MPPVPATSDDALNIPKGFSPRRAFFFVVGLLALGLGALGVVLPVLPTTPFVLLAAACFARSSRRFYGWILRNRIFGPVVIHWRANRTIPRHAKIIAISLIVLTFATSVVMVIPHVAVKLLVASIGVILIVWMLRIPSTSRDTVTTSAESGT